MADPLASFRGKPAARSKESKDGSEYEAFKAVDRRQIRLRIRPVKYASERVPYSYLLRIVEDGDYGTELALIYSFMAVVVKGRNLQAVGAAIDMEQCEFIEEFDPEKWPRPKDTNAPFIESIEIHVGKSGEEIFDET